MSIVMTGLFTREEAESLSERSANSDTLGYPATASFEEPDDPSKWRVDIYLLEAVDEDVLREELGPLADRLETKYLPDNVDWVKEGLKDLNPIAVGQFLVHGSHNKQVVRSFHHAIQIEANQAFGTGHHGTTAGCLEAISAILKKRDYKNILDLGTGSAVLAIALAKATKTSIVATDIDPISVAIAKENSSLNEVGSLISCETASGFHHPIFREKGPFDLIVANILAGPLRSLAQPMSCHIAPRATIILSGLLIHQKKAVLSAYREQGVRLIKAIHRDEWATLILQRP